jgi:hypothetical protein
MTGIIAAAPAGRWLQAFAPIDRDAARDAAAHELSKGIYHRDDPSLVQRIFNAVIDWLNARFDQAANAPGGPLGVLALVLVVFLVAALILWRTGPLRRASARPGPDLELSGPLAAEEHRRRANGYAAERRYAEAVRERMRAIVRELEARGVLEPRPGRTADEVAREAGVLVPGIAGDLRGAAQVFDEVWYGGRVATAGADAAMRQADQRLQSARLVVGAASAGPAPAGPQVPR